MAAPTPEQGSIFSEIKRTQELLTQVNASLLEQKDTLRQRGMTLPPSVLTTINSLDGDLKRLEAYLYEEQTELGQLRALANMSAALTTSLDIQTVLNEAMDIVIALTKAERGYIVLLDRANNTMEVRIGREDSLMGSSSRTTSASISSTVLQEVVSTRTPLLADNAFKDERLAAGASVANFTLRSVLCVPLMYKEDLIGAVYVDNRLQAGIFTERELNLLTAFANTAAVAISNAMYYAEIQSILGEITQVKELMDSIFASIGSGVIATDADDVVTTFNRAAEKMLEISADSAVNHPLTEVLPKLLVGLSDELEEVRRTNESTSFETDVSVPERGRVAVALTFNPLRDSQNNIQGVALVLDDITEQREREQQLNTVRTYLPAEMVDNIQTISNLALGGESREVTCVFAEVRSLYTMKDVNPREVLEVLNDYFAAATEAINGVGGIIDKYMGTEIMALFNTQLNPMSDHAARAVEAALNMRDLFLQHYAYQGINPNPHYYRIGMHTGICTLGNVGSVSRRDFTAIGDTINLAKRVEENTPYGSIIISEGTKNHLVNHPNGSRFRMVTLGELKAKGREETTPIYEVFRL
jgi:PAS domain S-box-containing protein